MGCALQFVTEEMQGDREVMMTAVASNGWAIRYATEEWRCDTQILEAALASARAIGGEPAALKARYNILLGMLSACSKRTAQENFGGL